MLEESVNCKGGEECQSRLHLCKMIERKVDPERIQAVVRDSLYFCRKCGRTAFSAQNLCKPQIIS